MLIFAPLNNDLVPLLQQVEVALFFQLPSFQIIGLPSPEVAEARERIRSAMEASGLGFPRKKVVVNLSPASVRKRGTGLDLAMALAILSKGIEQTFRLGAWGELGLDGVVKPAGQMTRTLFAAWQGGLTHLILSDLDHQEGLKALDCISKSGVLLGDPPYLIPVSSLGDAWRIVSEGKFPETATQLGRAMFDSDFDFGSPQPDAAESSLLPLSPSLERRVAIAAVGQHHVLLLGPRGVGKSHALEWLIALQPSISAADELQHRLLSELGRQMISSSPVPLPTLQGRPAIRRVGSQVRPAALMGGANSFYLRPGEFSLAHGGLLIADELPEWPRDSREILREPLERGKITLTRAQGALELPARFQLAANGNLCACGGWPLAIAVPDSGGEHNGEANRCSCSESSRRGYLSKLSGPILDRIDLVSILTCMGPTQKAATRSLDRLRGLRSRVKEARDCANHLWGKPPGMLSMFEVESLIEKNSKWDSWIADRSYLSLRSRHKIVKLAMSICAWDGEPLLKDSHLIEASYYRPEKYLKSSFGL